uniref:N/A n=1 Tax=Ganoderma boninense TaxID=34458 RepID=A0A5K1JZE6_9APHY|nr:N/A [Ganoderma boninense]
MHRVLCIAEILCLICDGVDGAALATLAQCCTTFHGPAIQVYWRSIPDFIPLVRCFPADAVRFKDTDGLISLVRQLEPEDWVAFIKYSKLVRHIGTREGTLWNIPDNVKLDDQFLRQLGESASRRMLALLPNLLSFDWAGCRLPPSDLSRTLCLLGTQVETVRITDWHEEKGPLVEALLLLGHYFPQLRVLELRRSHPDMPEGGEEEMWFMYGVGLNPNSKPYVPYSPLTLPGAYRLRVLTRLDCSAIPITETTFQALCQLPMLTSLSIHLPKPLAWPGMNNSSEAFQKLKDLTITAAALKDYCAFSALILFSQVETLHLRIARTTLRKNDIPRIFSAIKRQYSPTTLTTLSVCTSKLTPTPAVRRPVAWVYEDDIQQLFYFNNLVAFELGLNCSYNLGGYIYSELGMPGRVSNGLASGITAMPDITTRRASRRLCFHLFTTPPTSRNWR